MRRAAWVLMLLYAFTVPWEYSLDVGAPLGNIARIVGVMLLVAAIPAILQRGKIQRPGALQWTTLALYLWICCSLFWTIDQAVTLEKIRGYVQEMMVVWIAWELVESERDFRAMIWATVAGCWVLGLLTLWSAVSPGAAAQTRFAAVGQDPNDVARYLDLGFPLAALLIDWDARWVRWMGIGYFPLGLRCGPADRVARRIHRGARCTGGVLCSVVAEAPGGGHSSGMGSAFARGRDPGGNARDSAMADQYNSSATYTWRPKPEIQYLVGGMAGI